MPISEICNREVIVMQRSESVLDAAKLMRQHHVGNVLIVDSQNGARMPVGIVTDRDLVVEIMAAGLDGKTISVGEIMAPGLATVKEGTGIFEAIQYMRAQGVRRLPVVNDSGSLIGIIALDDLLELLSEELLALTKLVQHEQQTEAIRRH